MSTIPFTRAAGPGHSVQHEIRFIEMLGTWSDAASDRRDLLRGYVSEHPHGEPVPIITLDGLELKACHFVKVDVEGMEPEVLFGAASTIARHQPLLYVENDREARSRELIELVQILGYSAYWHFPPLFNPDNFAGDPHNIFPGIVSVNMLCAPKGYEIGGLRPVASPAETWQEAIEAERRARQ